MSYDSIPDDLMSDLRALFMEETPILPSEIPSGNLRLKLETADLVTPRIVFLAGDPKRISGQDATARVPFEIQLIQHMDRTQPDAHRIAAGKIDAWLREIRISKRREVISSRVWMHDLYNNHPVFSIQNEREQVATLRAETIVTLAVTTE
jgi:hypothetical protein